MQELISLFQDPVSWAALMALIVMEVVLGIDNLVFITVLTKRLPQAQRAKARRVGLILALVLRLFLLAGTAAIMRLTEPVIAILGNELSWRDIILVSGGLFLIWKATCEIHELVDPDPAKAVVAAAVAGFAAVIIQILALDVVFSIDSIVTAVGMTAHIPIMMIAVIVAVAAMMIAANPLAAFVEQNPTLVMLALGILLLIGTALVADGFGFHIPRGYVYIAMGFSGLIELLNILARRAKRRRTCRNRVQVKRTL